MSEIDAVSLALEQAVMDLLLPLQTTKTADAEAFARLHGHANNLARLLKGRQQLPRKIVNELYMTAKALQNEAPFAKDPTLIERWSSALYMTFDLILLGETQDDRTPGVPRVL